MKKTMTSVALAVSFALAACSGGSGAGATNGDSVAPAARASAAPTDSTGPATPVQMAQVARSTLTVTVSGPGHTDVIAEQRLRAPFKGTLSSLRVAPGDRVQAGEVVGMLVSQNSEAALAGARAMLAAAKTPEATRDAQRAVEIASQGLVQMPIRVPRSGIVVSRSASAGDLLSEGDSILGIAAADSIVFIAQIAQSDIAQVHPGQRAAVELAGHARPLTGTVYAILPADTANEMSLRVRIDLAPVQTPVTLGLFGTAHIIAGQHTNVPTVPAAALLRDDVYGISRIATVTANGHAHWVVVTPGISQGDRVEIASPAIPVGTRVITMGQVGLPEGARVAAERATDSATTPAAP